MPSVSDKPLIVQSDHTILVEVDSPRYAEARDALLGFAELVKSPEHVHTYRITPLSIWNACAAGHEADAIVAVLEAYSRYEPPANVLREVRDYASRYGRLRLVRNGDDALQLEVDDPTLMDLIASHRETAPLLTDRDGPLRFRIRTADRGRIKQSLVKAGFPAEDLAGYTPGEPLAVRLRTRTTRDEPFALRAYQHDAADAFHVAGGERGGSGVVVLPCGAGKTIVGMACMERVGASTLILTTSTTAVRQWIGELLDKTHLQPEQVGEYTGQTKDIRPVTVATYQILTHRRSQQEDFTHLALFDQRDWGLIIYDEVHLLPAPVFQVTASLQARRRLGLTATLVREDHREDDAFALIGPKKADVPWKVLERQGWIAKARCTEVRLALPDAIRTEYALAEVRQQFRIASENPAKLELVCRVLKQHPGQPALVIGMYVDQLKQLAESLNAPLITGSTSQHKRDQLFEAFRAGRLPVLVVSKVANFAIDLPDASLAIQVSGTFGSRQEEAQRLGRLLRPKPGANQAHFYTLVTRETREQDFALNRQLFLCEQGYQYRIVDAEESDEALSGSDEQTLFNSERDT
ncbi:MAG: DEAD/DEAH box helicase [Phycisphaeraceae bacterium]|nr:DEAD/DEAH box helicase [Phycisphaeraceae bacterium]